MSEESPFEDALEQRAICGIGSNPHEVLPVRCNKCFAFEPGLSRGELQEAGWRLFVETRIEDHPGFEVCPNCSGNDYSWEDLY